MSAAARSSLRLATQVVGFRVMRETEIAPSWWGRPVEIGETDSGIVADSYCAEQNLLTMDPNRVKRQRYFVNPIFASSVSGAVEAPAADDHGKTKDPLPQRPRGPHPYRVAS